MILVQASFFENHIIILMLVKIFEFKKERFNMINYHKINYSTNPNWFNDIPNDPPRGMNQNPGGMDGRGREMNQSPGGMDGRGRGMNQSPGGMDGRGRGMNATQGGMNATHGGR
jgi:hypothetical protein